MLIQGKCIREQALHLKPFNIQLMTELRDYPYDENHLSFYETNIISLNKMVKSTSTNLRFDIRDLESLTNL